MQGSLHLLLIHAKSNKHSLLARHSGRQCGGFPMKSGKQEHDGKLCITLHSEFGPHGEG